LAELATRDFLIECVVKPFSHGGKTTLQNSENSLSNLLLLFERDTNLIKDPKTSQVGTGGNTKNNPEGKPKMHATPQKPQHSSKYDRRTTRKGEKETEAHTPL
jgi:hypothetical protein